MNGSLDPEERILDEPTINELVASYVEKLGWSVDDEITVELGGTQVSGIDVGEEYNRKWQSPIGTRKYNKDCFIVIKNQSRRDLTGSLPMDREHKPQHPYTPVEPQDIVVNLDGGVGGSWEVKEDTP
tara:strand:+ start:889 stop:1269 length:381 start_codon:yes stop_codon:yes gene_type:complete